MPSCGHPKKKRPGTLRAFAFGSHPRTIFALDASFVGEKTANQQQVDPATNTGFMTVPIEKIGNYSRNNKTRKNPMAMMKLIHSTGMFRGDEQGDIGNTSTHRVAVMF